MAVTDRIPVAPPRRGRPRDESVRDRVLAAAIVVYDAHGWSGLNFESVASVAHVGRPALYRRWADRSALLIDAFLSTTPEVTDRDMESLPDELLRLVSEFAQSMEGPRGRAATRLYLDRPVIPEIVNAVHERLMGRRVGIVSAAIRRASIRVGRRSAIPDRLAFALLFGAPLQWNGGAVTREPVDAAAVAQAVVKLTGLCEGGLAVAQTQKDETVGLT